jgi:hypothetical protein
MDKSSLEALIRWLEIWSAVFGVIVVIGVAGESYFGIRLLWNNWKLQRIQAGENAQLLVDVATANARAEEAKRAAAEANEKAERERLERLKIEKKLAPRAFNSYQRETMLKQLKLVGQWASADLIAIAGTDEFPRVSPHANRASSAPREARQAAPPQAP